MLNSPRAVAVDGAGNLYIADTGNNRVRRVSTTGQITTVAGNGIPGTTGDAGLAVSAQIVGPIGIAVDASGNLYLSDGSRIRKVFASGFITTIAGGTTPGYSGDGGSASTAQFNGPAAVAVDSTGNLYVADSGNHAIRRLSPDRRRPRDQRRHQRRQQPDRRHRARRGPRALRRRHEFGRPRRGQRSSTARCP